MKAVSPREFYSWILAITTLVFAHLILGGENGDFSGYVVLAVTLALLLVAIYKFIQSEQVESSEAEPPTE